jgi:hypothetical protein
MSRFIKRAVATLVLTAGLFNASLADEDCSLNFKPHPRNFVTFYPTIDCDPCSKLLDNISVYGSWLYWKVSGDELDYAVEKVRNHFSTKIQDHETIHNVKFGWDSGFRVGAGAELPCRWRVDTVWTHFRNASSQSTEIHGTEGNAETFVSLPAVYRFGDQLLSNEAADFSGRIRFRYDTVDIEFGKWCCCTPCVKFRPHIGVRVAEIYDGFHNKVLFTGDAVETFSNTDAPYARFFAKNRFKGAGIRAGFDLDLCLCEGLSLIGRGAGSIVWGRTRLSQNFKYPILMSGDLYHSKIDDRFRNSRVITDLSLGIRYKTTVCCFPVIAELAWEHHFIFNPHRFWVDNSFVQLGSVDEVQPVLLPLTTSSWKKNGTISLQGLTLSLGIEF